MAICMLASLLLQPEVPFFLRETVEMEVFALPPKIPDDCSLGTYGTKMATSNA